MTHRKQVLVLALAVLLLGVLGPAPAEAQGNNLVRRPHVTLDIRPLGAAVAATTEAGQMTLEVNADTSDEADLALLWPDSDNEVSVHIEATWAAGPGETGRRVRIRTTLTLPPGGIRVVSAEEAAEEAADPAPADDAEAPEPDDGAEEAETESEPVVAERTLAVGERETISLFEVYRYEETPLMLAIEATPGTQTTYNSTPTIGSPVRLHLEIQRVIDGDAVTVERDQLDTFVHQMVSYSFRMGDNPDDESLLVELTPHRLIGDIVEMEAGVSGKLPGPDGLVMLSRQDTLMISRGIAQIIAAETGDPPTGYRFLVTPEF